MSIILALLAAIFAALTGILAKIGIINVNSNLATAMRTIIVLMMAFLMVLLTNQLDNIFLISMKSLIFIVLSGITTGLSWLCYFKAIQIGDVSKVVPIDKSSVVMTILLSFIILGEPVTSMVVIGGTLITIGTFVLIGRIKKNSDSSYSNSYIVLAFLSAIFAALTAILVKIGIEDVDSNVATFIRTIVIMIFAWAIVYFQRTHPQMKTISRKSYIFLFLSGIATGLSWLCFFAAISIGKVSIVAPIDKFSVVITMILSIIILKEKPTKNTIFGCLIITIGTILLLV
ncbi:GRP family sugar transporter [Paenibacillus sp. BSR1-1]|uniref:EamA family transporter n=1 Tax=Paenibacillus sp. BSR1-1 TaxID=3020845 RepID=UPI0025B17C49|nr:GRP family sugar transporter [Paenibacillus sp. BSR1-1]MDN3015732.1 GRP family sugar transporter [Paenibacillus sp. BSR1-1]